MSMGTTYYIDRKIDLFGVYECSKCKSIELLQFRLLASGGSTMSQKKAAEATEEPCRNLLNALQDFRKKPFLLSKKYNGRTITSGYEIGFEHGDHHCPFCDNQETWQRGEYYADACTKDPDSKVPLVPECPEASRMMVFSDHRDAIEAVNKLLAFRKTQYAEYWSNHPEEAERVKAQIDFLKNSISALEPQKAAAREKSDRLNEQINEKEAQMKKLSLFSPDKKAAKAELKELSAKYSAQKDADILEERRLAKEISSYAQQLKELKIAKPGVLDILEKFHESDDDEFAHLAAHLS